jgi:hypothetical protein
MLHVWGEEKSVQSFVGISWVNCAVLCVKDDWKRQFWGLRYCLSKLRSLLSFSVRYDVTHVARMRRGEAYTGICWDFLSELRSSLCERRPEKIVLRPALWPVKTPQFTQFFRQVWRHTCCTMRRGEAYTGICWDFLSELRSSLCESWLEKTVLRPALLPVKTPQFTQFFRQVWRYTCCTYGGGEAYTRFCWDSLRELRCALCERRLEKTVLRPALLPVKTAQFTQFFPQL